MNKVQMEVLIFLHFKHFRLLYSVLFQIVNNTDFLVENYFIAQPRNV